MPFFAEYSPDLADPLKSSIKLEDFLTMRSGIEWATPGQTYDDPTHPTVQLEASDRWIDEPRIDDLGVEYD